MRYDAYYPSDEAPMQDADLSFSGVDMFSDPSQVSPGLGSEAVNKDFSSGDAATRLGHMPVNENSIFTDIHGVGVFKDPNDVTRNIIAADGGVYWWFQGNAFTAIPCVETITGRVKFTQAFDVMIMWRGESLDPLVMETVGEGFKVITQTNTGDGTESIPPASSGLFFASRVFIPHGDEVAASDILDYTRYSPTYNDFRINQGSNDSLVGLYKFGPSTIIAAKEKSIHAVSSVYSVDGNLSSIRQDEVTKEYGIKGSSTGADVGGDFWFLVERRGVCSLRLSEQDNPTATNEPVSKAIQPLIDRINWRYADNACAAFYKSKYYLAVPLDDAELIGDELISGASYSASSYTVTGLTIGATYRYTQGANDGTLTNGSESLTGSNDFVAQGTSVSIAVVSGGSATASVTASMKLVKFVGVNNAILVYDFTRKAWYGHWEGDQVNVRDFFITDYDGVSRLFYTNDNGMIVLVDEGFEDFKLEAVTAYVDVMVDSLPSVGNTIVVNGGTTVTVDGSATNGASTWGCSTVDLARTNLYSGFNSTWTHPDVTVQQIDYGVRFISSNGVAPVVTIVGSWAHTDAHSGSEIVPQVISDKFVTRGYSYQDPSKKRYRRMDACVETWNPSYTITAVCEGVLEESVIVEDFTRDRTKYYSFNTPPYSTANTADDHGDAYRQDYSVAEEATGINLDDSGIDFEAHQQYTHRLNAVRQGRYVQYRFESAQGRLAIKTVGPEAVAGEKRQGVLA